MIRSLKNSFYKYFIVSIAFYPNIISGQESLEPVIENPQLCIKKFSSKKVLASRPDTLPFFDDFAYASGSKVFPNEKDWTDKNVYVNNNYGFNTVSVGVATFDALDSEGKFYAKAETNFSTAADTLTSRHINLKNYKVSDSLYLNFLYQAEGLGERPDESDSLILQFYSNKNNKWKTVWSAFGPNGENSVMPFKPILVKLDDTMYYDTLFQFRFINIVSIYFPNNAKGVSANGDIWNIDYVYLNSDRNFTDTTSYDVSIAEPVMPFLKIFSSIPWKHYKDVYHLANKSQFNLKTFNYRDGNANVTDWVTVRDVYGKYDFDPLNSAEEASPYSYLTFIEDIPIFISDQTDSALFQIKSQITPLDNRPENNNSITYQNFNNYYAYDDSTAEYGYGLRGDNTIGAMVAYKIDGYKSDTLSAIDIYFNRSLKNENVAAFDLMVWNEKDTIPGDSIAGIAGCNIEEPNLNKFRRYYLDTPKIVPAKFYIGWKQIDETFLNVGYDRNNLATQYICYNTEGTRNSWLDSKLQKKGALMIRPVYGKRAHVNNQIVNNKTVRIYPNPASSLLNFNFTDSELTQSMTLSVIDLTGNIRIKQKFVSNSINIQQLKPGIYFVTIQSPIGNVYVTKFVKQ